MVLPGQKGSGISVQKDSKGNVKSYVDTSTGKTVSESQAIAISNKNTSKNTSNGGSSDKPLSSTNSSSMQSQPITYEVQTPTGFKKDAEGKYILENGKPVPSDYQTVYRTYNKESGLVVDTKNQPTPGKSYANIEQMPNNTEQLIALKDENLVQARVIPTEKRPVVPGEAYAGVIQPKNKQTTTEIIPKDKAEERAYEPSPYYIPKFKIERQADSQESAVPEYAQQKRTSSKGIFYKDPKTGEDKFIPEYQLQDNLNVFGVEKEKPTSGMITSALEEKDLTAKERIYLLESDKEYAPKGYMNQLDYGLAKQKVETDINPSYENVLTYFGQAVYKGGLKHVIDFGVINPEGNLQLPLTETVKGTVQTITHPVKTVETIQENPIETLGESTGSALVLAGVGFLAGKAINAYVEGKTSYGFVGEADVKTVTGNKVSTSTAQIKGLGVRKVGGNVKQVVPIQQVQKLKVKTTKATSKANVKLYKDTTIVTKEKNLQVSNYEASGSITSKTKDKTDFKYFDTKGTEVSNVKTRATVEVGGKQYKLGKGKTVSESDTAVFQDKVTNPTTEVAQADYKFIKDSKKSFSEGELVSKGKKSDVEIAFNEYTQGEASAQTSNVVLKKYGTESPTKVVTQVSTPKTVTTSLIVSNIAKTVPELLKAEPVTLRPVPIIQQQQKEELKPVETKLVSRIKQDTRTKTETILAPKTSEVSETKPQTLRPIEITLTKTKQNQNTIQSNKLNTTQLQIQSQQQSQETIPILRQQVTSEVRSQRRLNQVSPKIKAPIPKVEKLPFKKEQRGEAFTVFVKSKGEFKQLGSYKTIEEASQRGQFRVGQTASASFKIDSSQGAVGANQVRLGEKFTTSKRSPNVFVQKRQYRISSAGEKQEITRKGVFASRMKADRKRRTGVFGL